MKLVVSSYKTDGKSMVLYDINKEGFKELSSVDIAAPSFVVSDGVYVYTYGKENGMSLYSYKVVGGNLVEHDKLSIPGKSATHLTFSKKNNILFGCSYSDGSYFSVGVKDGKFEKLYLYKKQIEDDRLSRCHQVLLNKDETTLAVVNIALDEVYLYDIQGEDLVYKNKITLPTGVGPRHAIYNKANSLMYIMTEYSNEVIIVRMDSLEVIDKISTVPNYKDTTYGATLFISKDEKYLFASNRGEDSIAKFKILEGGKLEYVNSFSSGGAHPRHMILSENGKYIISCNKDGNNVAIIDIDREEVVIDIPFTNVSGVELI